MRSVISVLTVLMMVALADTALADTPKPDDTLAQLKAAQDRKAELATENGKLLAQVAELQKQLQIQTGQLDELKRQAAIIAERTFFLSSHYAAWTQFISANPAIKKQWELFLRMVVSVDDPQGPFFMDPDWPLSVEQ